MDKLTLVAGVMALCAAAPLSVAAEPEATGDAVAGKKAFTQCSLCHSLQSGQNKIGPHLAGLWGREAGSVAGFNYSAAMQNSGIVWSDETLAAYLADPKGNVPGTSMMIGIRNPADLPDLLAYLKQETE